MHHTSRGIDMTLCDMTIGESLDWMRRGELTSVELTQAALDRIVSVDNDIRAYLTVAPSWHWSRRKKRTSVAREATPKGVRLC